MRILSSMTRLLALMAAFGLFFAATGCSKPDANGTGDQPKTDLGEGGSTTGGGAEVPPTSAKEPIADNPKSDAPKTEEPKVEEPKVEEPKVDAPKVEEPKVEAPKAEEAK